ncbi:MAG TPA: ABC transporter substrate-binding protein [Polyangiaceae bacterium]|jgi:ABC-type transporter MlaC component
MSITVGAITTLALALSVTGAGPAFAQDSGAQAFVEGERLKIVALLRQPASPDRDADIGQAVETLADYVELSRRSLGEPCPKAEPGCQDHWASLSEDQRAEVIGLVKQLVARRVVDGLRSVLDYGVTYKGVKRNAEGDARVRTEIRSRRDPHAPAMEVDYVVRPAPGGYRVVDIVTDGSSLTRNYYDQIHLLFANRSNGYTSLVAKLSEVARR